MLSYRHGYHAGNLADVLKHATFCFTLAYALQKPRPVYVLDTHAGAGAYDLRTPMAGKTGEYRDGIGRVMPAAATAPALFTDYLRQVQRLNRPGELAFYPGSPALADGMLRPGDRLGLVEMHASDHQALIASFASRRRVRVSREDGLAALVNRMPPVERRGIVLTDPSYEIKSDYDDVIRALIAGYRKFPSGIYLLWYPVISRPRIDTFLERLRDSGMRRLLRLEFGMLPDSDGHGMTSSGLVVVNPPWPLFEAARDGVTWLADLLAARGPRTVEWLVGE